MNKVLIIGNGTHSDNCLFELLKELFPDCLIVVQTVLDLFDTGRMKFNLPRLPRPQGPGLTD
jgi:hypothetical protein